ncbi:peptidase [Gimesia aquarii]|uniref:NHL repeat protein n=1 Tax=Gimesia aquarii TaxID=2527964 RepID=A0A517X3H1_9PLAN|nr:peptidase [Gimesia aquarii]QDU12056.1 NHL repeat protein [Gimesia aquarii]
MDQSSTKRGDKTASRRTFLKSTGAAVVGGFFAPAILGAEDKAGVKNPIMGEGEYKYEAIHGWGEVPKHIQWGETHGVCVDEAGLIYVKHRSKNKTPMDAIVVFSPEGKFVRSFGKEYHGGGHGIDVRKEGNEEFLYLSDTKHGVVAKTNLKGEVVWKISRPETPEHYKKSNTRYSPTNVAFAPDGGVYVGDGYGSHFIHKYTKDGKFEFSWGGSGTEAGKMKTPHGMWLDERSGKPKIAVCDRANHRLQYFTLDGKHLGFVNTVSFPADIDIRGDLMVVSDLHARVTLFDKNNKVITHLGYNQDWTNQVLDGFKVRKQPRLWKAGRFIHPHDACFDGDGNLFVTEWVSVGRVSKLKKLS